MTQDSLREIHRLYEMVRRIEALRGAGPAADPAHVRPRRPASPGEAAQRARATGLASIEPF